MPPPFTLFACPCFTKKLTVIGTIGQTHGITRASSPPRAEAIIKGMMPCWAFCSTSLLARFGVVASTGVLAVLLGELWLGLLFLGRRFEKLDLSSELRS